MSLSSAPKVADLDALKQKFKAADKDNSGSLNRREFDTVLHQMGFTNKNLNIAIYNAQDDDNDHKISETEFIEFVHDHDAIVKNLEAKSSEYNTMFNQIDVNKNGSITPEELKTYLSSKHPENKGIDRLIQRSFKLDADKKITVEEFHHIMAYRELRMRK